MPSRLTRLNAAWCRVRGTSKFPHERILPRHIFPAARIAPLQPWPKMTPRMRCAYRTQHFGKYCSRWYPGSPVGFTLWRSSDDCIVTCLDHTRRAMPPVGCWRLKLISLLSLVLWLVVSELGADNRVVEAPGFTFL